MGPPCFLLGSQTCGCLGLGTGADCSWQPGLSQQPPSSSFLGVAQPITWLGTWSRLLTSADTGRGSRSQADTSWQPHLHKSLIV